MSITRDIARFCEGTRVSMFPCPQGLALTNQNETALNAVFAREARLAWLDERGIEPFTEEEF